MLDLEAIKKFRGYDEIDQGFNNDGLARFNKSGKTGLINQEGKEVIPPIYDELYAFRNGLAPVKLDGKIGFIDKENNVVIPIKYDMASFFSHDGLANVELDGQRFKIDRRGREYYDESQLTGYYLAQQAIEAAKKIVEEFSKSPVVNKESVEELQRISDTFIKGKENELDAIAGKVEQLKDQGQGMN